MALESEFQKRLKKEIKERFPGCYVLKNDPTMIQGIPDLTVLYEDKWAWLEVKKSATAKRDPKQIYYIECAKKLSFGSFIYPENKEEVLDELERTFRPSGKAFPV